jgi:phosphopantetheinyl transferase
VDLEANRPREFLRLARFAFAEREVIALEAAPDEARPQLFYTLWTLKESFAKALRLDLVDAVRQCVFWKDDGEWRGQVPTTAAWSAAVFQPRPHLFLAAAFVGEQRMPPLQQWEWPPHQGGNWPLIVRASAPAAADAVQA